MIAAHRARKRDSVTDATMRLRQATDHLWLAPFHAAWRKITWAAQTGMEMVFIRLPFPFDDDMNDWCERIACYWKHLGYHLRPGGPAGPAQDIIRLERGA